MIARRAGIVGMDSGTNWVKSRLSRARALRFVVNARLPP